MIFPQDDTRNNVDDILSSLSTPLYFPNMLFYILTSGRYKSQRAFGIGTTLPSQCSMDTYDSEADKFSMFLHFPHMYISFKLLRVERHWICSLLHHRLSNIRVPFRQT